MFSMELDIRGAFELADYKWSGGQIQIQIFIVLLIYY